MPNRNYKKNLPHRDSRYFVIVAEGEREDAYFQFFHGKNQRIRIEIVPREGKASAPTHFLKRLAKFKEDAGWNPKDNDVAWFVLDVDMWKTEQIHELINYCEQNDLLNIAISNPFFEIWLLHHLTHDLTDLSNNLKNDLHIQAQKNGFEGYHPSTFCPLLETAIQNAKRNDTSPTHSFPNAQQTKVYLLAEQLLEKLGNNWL